MIERISIEQWLAFDAAHPAPTFFARPAWSLALAHAYPQLAPHPVHVRIADQTLLVPLMRNAGGRLNWREYVGMPLGGYTCALRTDGSLASAQEFGAALLTLSQASDSMTITPWPMAETRALPAWRTTRHETAVIDLSDGVEAALSGVDGVSRRMAGQAERRGVECAPCRSGSAAAIYYGILREASEHWGLARPPYTKELLDGLIAYGGADVEVWLAECDNHPIAGGIVFYGSEEMFFWSAAMRQDFSRLRPSNALNIALIRTAAQRRMRWYNLGASEGLPGVERFKKGLGARTVAYAQLHRQHAAYSVYSHIRQTLQRMPVYGGQ
jgi:hypothetical protein